MTGYTLAFIIYEKLEESALSCEYQHGQECDESDQWLVYGKVYTPKVSIGIIHSLLSPYTELANISSCFHVLVHNLL